VGKGNGKDSYPLRLEGRGISEIDGYVNGRVNALPLPYPTHCHPYLCEGQSIRGSIYMCQIN
jgi:hypothetical protein